MMQRGTLVLLAALMPAAAQDITVTSTTLAQIWKQDTPGFSKATQTPATQFLGIDATQVGFDALSLHLFGWGQTFLQDVSGPRGRTSGDLTYGYLQYRLPTANAELKAGRFYVDQGVGIEQVDGVSARADLKGGFTVSAFGGQPVWHRGLEGDERLDYRFQHDWIAGTRIGKRLGRIGEVGLSYLQDGSQHALDLPIPSSVNYTRKLAGADLSLMLHSRVLLQGRTVLDLAKRFEGLESSPSRVAEHDYTLNFKLPGKATLSGTYTERNLFAFYNGSNFRSLFKQDEKDKHKSTGGRFAMDLTDVLAISADYKHVRRESFGTSNRFGGDLRWTHEERKWLGGVGYHKVEATDARLFDPNRPYYSLSHDELRGWLMWEGSMLSASVDAIRHGYADAKNPNLRGQSVFYEFIASGGVRPRKDLRISADMSVGATTVSRREVRGLLRAEFRFQTTRQGGK